MIERARAELGLDRDSDASVVERALNAYLLGRVLDLAKGGPDLPEEEADRLAYDELRAARREHGGA